MYLDTFHISTLAWILNNNSIVFLMVKMNLIVHCCNFFKSKAHHLIPKLQSMWS